MALPVELGSAGVVPVVVYFAALSTVAFAAYGLDKAAARGGRWRTSEATLHALSLFGGWPGALAAQRVFRHKTRKQPFRAVFWCTLVLNCAAVTALALWVSAAAR